MEVLFVYLWTQLHSFTFALSFAAGAMVALWIICAAVRDCSEDVDSESYKKAVQIHSFCAPLFLLFTVAAVLLPSQNTVAVMVGTHYAVKLSGSEEGAKVASLIRKKANEYLDEQLKDAK